MCEFSQRLDILFNKDIIVQLFHYYIQFDCEGYGLSGTFHRTKIKLLVFKLCLVSDPDRCYGFQETYDNCPHKLNTIYKFCS